MKKYFLFSLIILAAILSACQSEESKGDAGENGSESDDELTIIYSSSLDAPDPQGVSNAPRRAVDVNVFNRLFRMDDDLEIQPELVEDYEMEDDTTLNIKLKEDVEFHNGDSLTSEDVKYSIERVAQDESHIEYQFFSPIKEVEVIDDYNLNVITKEPTPVLLDLLSKPASEIIPKEYMEENGEEYFNENPVGSGPYEYVEFVKDDHIELKPFKNYFEGKADDWEKVNVRFISESSTRVGELLTGNADIVDNVPPSEWENIEAGDTASVVRADTPRVIQLIPKQTPDSPLEDPKVREAIELAIDKETLTEDVLKGGGEPIRTRNPEGIFGSNPDLTNTSIYDPEKAKELLSEAGYEDALEITFQVPTSGYVLINDVAEMIKQMLEDVGITVNMEQREQNTLIEDLQVGNNEGLTLIGYSTAYYDAAYTLSGYYSERGEKVTGYKSEEFDELYEKALSNMDDEEREKQYQKLQEIVAEDRPYIHLYQQFDNYGVSNDIDFTPRIDEQIIFSNLERK